MQIRSMVIYPRITGQPVFGWSDRSGENQYKETAGSKSRPAEDFVFSLSGGVKYFCLTLPHFGPAVFLPLPAILIILVDALLPVSADGRGAGAHFTDGIRKNFIVQSDPDTVVVEIHCTVF